MIKTKDFLKYAGGDDSVLTIQSGWKPKNVKRKIGDIWSDSKGFKWIQKNGYVCSHNETAEIIRKNSKKICKDCGKDIDWGSKLDKKMFNLSNRCFDCNVAYETKLKITGKYELYEHHKMLNNQFSYLQEIKTKIKELYKEIPKDHTTFSDITGLDNTLVQEEKWSTLSKSDLKIEYLKDFKQVCKQMSLIKKELKK